MQTRREIFFQHTIPSLPVHTQAQLLIDALKPGSNASSDQALRIIEQVGSDVIRLEYHIDTQITFRNCELDGAENIVGTQCLASLFHPSSGWIRDCTKRGDMLKMTAKLVALGAKLDGIYYYRHNPVITNQSIIQTIQSLINRRNDDPPAELNSDIIHIFQSAQYHFTYPAGFSSISSSHSDNLPSPLR